MCSELDLLLSDAENAAGAPPGAPRTIERSPRNLIGEARAAFDAGARELTGIAATGGKDHPTARLSGPCPGEVWHRVQELAGRARTRFPRRVRIATLDPLPRGSKNAIAWLGPRTQPACSWDGQSLVIEAGENCPSDARGEALPVVVLAPRA